MNRIAEKFKSDRESDGNDQQSAGNEERRDEHELLSHDLGGT